MIRINILLILFSILLTCTANGQGCSDAGFCTINSFKPNNTGKGAFTKNQFKLGLSMGSADRSITVFGNYIEYSQQLADKFAVDIKITSLSQSGNDISVFGPSDIYLNGNIRANENVTVTFGTKIPLTNGNKKKGGLPLPMDYQSSLGTIDLVLGLGFAISKFQLVAAIQQPLSQNGNEFIAENYPLSSKLRAFQSTNKFKRSGDILLRVSYPLALGKKCKLTPSILPIYHLANDKYSDVMNIEKSITGSQGLTLNGNAYFDYEINNKNNLQLSVGMPFVTRDTRPDGLTRHFVANLEYRLRF